MPKQKRKILKEKEAVEEKVTPLPPVITHNDSWTHAICVRLDRIIELLEGEK